MIDSLLMMQTGTYPQGWLDRGTEMTDHNNYDVAELFYRGWIQMVPRQRQAASIAVNEMKHWCLGGSVKDDGSLVCPDMSDPIPDSFCYAASFLDRIGYFDKTKRFWTAGVPPDDPTKIRTGMVAQLRSFNPYYTEVDDTLARLGAPRILGPLRSSSANPCKQGHCFR